MNGHTRRSSNVRKDKTSRDKKRKSTIRTNHGGTNDRGEEIAAIANGDPTMREGTMTVHGRDSNSSKRGKRDSFYANVNISSGHSSSSITSVVDTSDDSESNDETVIGGQFINGGMMRCLIKNVEDINFRMKTLEHRQEEMMKQLLEKKKVTGDCILGQDMTPLPSIITGDGKKSLSDLSISQNTSAYFDEKSKELERRLTSMIQQNMFGDMKFLVSTPLNGKDGGRNFSTAEKVVIKAIDMKQVTVPKEMDKREFITKGAKLVTRLYNEIRGRAQSGLRKVWFGES